MKTFYLKIILPTILSILLFILTIFLIIIPRFQQSIMNGKREMIKELTNSAWSILVKYEKDEKEGLITREEAQFTAISRIQYLRYGEENKDYFWITDMTPTMIIHPYRQDLKGKDLSNVIDPHGKRLFVEFVNTVKKSEHGYVEYMWQWKDDSLQIVPKLSYVKIFKPWNWVIGTGIYIEDVKKEISILTNKLLSISIGITILIAFLLFYIFKQSLNIEKKRIQAENDLHESKEKYKTLVEAATEGLIMLIDGRISFSNSIMSKLTGYDTNELLNRTLIEIIGDNNNTDIIETFSKNIVEEGQYDINLKKKNGGFIEVLVTSSTARYRNETVNIIIVKDITIDRNSNLSVLDYQKLLNTLNIGFFRVNIDNNGKFIFANETTVKTLGYSNFRQLSEIQITKLLVNNDDKLTLRKTLIENGFIKNKVVKILKNNNEPAFVAITLVLYNSDNNKDLICDGIIEDITIQEQEKAETKDLITQLKSMAFLMEQAIKEFITPAYRLDTDSTIKDAVKVLALRKTDNLLITKDEKHCIGIVTGNDIQQRVLSLNLHLDNPVYLIMSAPVMYITENTSVFDSINICDAKKINHLVVKNGNDEITGILKIDDIYKSLKNSLSFFKSNIENAETKEQLIKTYRKLLLLIKPLIKSEISVNYITSITSSFSDSIIHRLIDLTIQEIGTPPVGFSFICLGSEGRKEETLFTDQDNAIIYEDVPPEKEVFVDDYFNKLGEKVCNALNDIGYSFCKGNIMAKNRQWCKPLSVWEIYFTTWMLSPEPQNLLDATIFFDFRNVYGSDDFTNKLRKTITQQINERPLFLYHMAYNTFNTKVQQISAGKILVDKNADQIELKNAISIIVMFARTYSLQNNIWCTNTIERLNALKENKIVSESTIHEIVFAYNFLMKIRFRNQMNLSDNNLPLSNVINTKKLIEVELSVLKKVLSLFPNYQTNIGTHFRITT